MPVDMRVSVNTETGRIVGDAKSLLAFVKHIQPSLAERKANTTEIEKARTKITNAINAIDFYTKSAEKFSGEIDADARNEKDICQS